MTVLEVGALVAGAVGVLAGFVELVVPRVIRHAERVLHKDSRPVTVASRIARHR